jgi:hypothetical protein
MAKSWEVLPETYAMANEGTRPNASGFLLDALKWACEMPTHRWPSVRLFDGYRLPF